MSTFNQFNNTILAIAKGQINFEGDTFKIYLTNVAPNASTHSVKADLAEISAGNGYTAGGKVINVASVTQTGGVLSVAVDDPGFWEATGGPISAFRYVVMYDDTTTNDTLIGYWDYGSSISPKDQEKFTPNPTGVLFTGSLTAPA